MKLLSALLPVIVCLAAAVHAQQPAPPEHPLITAERWEQITAGNAVVEKLKVSQDESRGGAKAVVFQLINAPAQKVFETLLQFENQPEYMPRLQKVVPYEMPAPERGYEFTVKVAWKTVRYHLRVTPRPETLRVQWTLDDSRKNDIKTTFGSWDIVPWGEDKSVAVYQLEVDTGMPVPKFVAQMLLNQDLPGVVEALKKRVESGGTYKKD